MKKPPDQDDILRRRNRTNLAEGAEEAEEKSRRKMSRIRRTGKKC